VSAITRAEQVHATDLESADVRVESDAAGLSLGATITHYQGSQAAIDRSATQAGGRSSGQRPRSGGLIRLAVAGT